MNIAPHLGNITTINKDIYNDAYTSRLSTEKRASVGFRTYEAPYLGPEGGRPGRPTQAVRHTCSGKLGIVKILRYIRSDMYTASSTN